MQVIAKKALFDSGGTLNADMQTVVHQVACDIDPQVSCRHKRRRFSVGIFRICPVALCGAGRTRCSKPFQMLKYAFAVGFAMTCFLVV